MPTPISDDERRRIRELHAAGMSRNAIARSIGRSYAGVTRVCQEMGLDFDRSKTAVAVESAQIDAKARRLQLQMDLLEDAGKLRAQLWEPTELHAFGGKDNTHNSVLLEEPVFRDKRDIMGAASMAVTAALRLDSHDTGGSESAKSVIAALAAGLGVVADQLGGDDD